MVEVVATFAVGPLGLALSRSNAVVNLVAGGQAAAAGLQVGDEVVKVGETNVKGLVHEDVLGVIKAAGRPMTLTFVRGAAPAETQGPAAAGAAASATQQQQQPTAAATASGAAKQQQQPALASTVSAAQAVKKAGSIMKGFLGAGVQVVKAFDRVIDKAIDDTSKQAKVSLEGRRAAHLLRSKLCGITNADRLPNFKL
jgi:hypothetical protein